MQLDYFTGHQSLPVYSLSDRGFWRVRDLSTKSCHCSRDFCSAVASCAQLKVKLWHFVKSSRWVHCTLKAPPLVKYWTVLVFPIHSNIYTTVRSPRVAINRKWCIFAFVKFPYLYGPTAAAADVVWMILLLSADIFPDNFFFPPKLPTLQNGSEWSRWLWNNLWKGEQLLCRLKATVMSVNKRTLHFSRRPLGNMQTKNRTSIVEELR